MPSIASDLDTLDTFITHQPLVTYEEALAQTEARLQQAEQLTLPLEQSLDLLHQLTEFELGRFLLTSHGLNGYWTAYAILHPDAGTTPLESWLLKEAPAVKATRERFYMFQDVLQHYLQPGQVVASIPCGMMDDLLLLPSDGSNPLVGIDLDPASLEGAKQNAEQKGRSESCQFFQQDAWQLEATEPYHIITSNGLNIYEPDETRVIALYENFYEALAPEGIFITSFLTPPPMLDPQSPWKIENMANLVKQKAIFSDILQVKWQVFRGENTMRAHLEQVGFKILDVIYDTQGMFPTIIAQK